MEYVSWIINILFICACIYVYRRYRINCCNKCDELSDSLRDIIERLTAFKNQDRNIAYYDIDGILTSNSDTNEAWNEYKKTLTPVQDSQSGIIRLYSTEAASDYVNFTSITSRINIAFWQNLGGIFTGIGILGTFVGLVLGLWNIDISNVAKMSTSIRELLAGISTAFFTSLVGVSFALGFNYVHNKAIVNLKEKTAELASLLEEFYPRKTQEMWLAEAWEQGRQQTDALNNLSADLAVKLGDEMQTKMSASFEKLAQDIARIMKDSLAPTLQGVKESLDNLNNGGVKAIGEGINDSVGTELRGFAGTLMDLQKQMQESFAATQKTGESTNQKLMTVVNQLAENVQASSNEALAAQKRQMQDANSQMAQMMQQMQASAASSGDELTKSISDVTAVMRSAMDEAATTQNETLASTCKQIRDVLSEVNNTLKKSTADTTQAQQTQVEATMQQMNSIMESMRQSAENSSSQMTNAISSVTDVLRSTMNEAATTQNETLESTCKQIRDVLSEVNNTLKESTAETTQAQQTQVEATMRQMNSIMEGIRQSAENSSSQMTNAISSVTDVLHSTMDDAAGKQKATLEETCTQIKNVLTEVNENLKAATNKMVDASAAANASLLATMTAVNDKASGAAAAYAQSASIQAESMDNASNAMKQNLQATVDKLQQLLDGHNKAMTKAYNEFNDITGKATNIVASAKEAAGKFGEAAGPVSLATNGLKEQLEKVVAATVSFNNSIGTQNRALTEAARVNEANMQRYLESLQTGQRAWKAYEEHFAGISGEMERTFNTLENGIKNYQATTDKGLKNNLSDFDKAISNAINIISTNIGELTDNTDALKDCADALTKAANNIRRY